MNDSSLSVAIISDLHAFDPNADLEGEVPPSHLEIGAPDDEPHQHPIPGLKRLIEQQENLQADILICCGDMGDKARPAATRYVWDQVNHLRRSLGDALLVATAGNHDVDSRYKYNDFDAKGVLQSLRPPFPLADESRNDKYWARNFVLLSNHVFRIVLLNSSAYQGGRPEEFHHGRVSQRTVDAIGEELEAEDPPPINVLVCHHHPYKNDDHPAENYSEMQGGDALLQLLGSGDYGRWVVVHGHKHLPRLRYAAGGIASPVVFSAGSLSAVLYPELQTRARNQFYLVQFPWGRLEELGLEVAGTFRAWDWISAKGWQPATPSSGLPGRGGFGYRPEAEAVAAEIAAIIADRPFSSWDDLLDKDPRLEFLAPEDLDVLKRRLNRVHSVELVQDEHGEVQLAKRTSS